MEQTIIKSFSGTPFFIECSTVENSPGTWASTKIAIFKDEIFIGEYIRNYSAFGPATFYPFQIDNEWYALYSAEYTTTRVMKLHDDRIEDWCGEAPLVYGFCPTEFYVPRYNYNKLSYEQGEKLRTLDSYIADCDMKSDSDFLNAQKFSEFVSTHYCDFGLLSGCVWGDDTSWKLRYIDLSKISDKIIDITEKFGYWELPSSLKLKDCINMNGWEPKNHNWIELTRVEHINLKTGERC